jgi:hypothetical protein
VGSAAERVGPILIRGAPGNAIYQKRHRKCHGRLPWYTCTVRLLTVETYIQRRRDTVFNYFVKDRPIYQISEMYGVGGRCKQ